MSLVKVNILIAMVVFASMTPAGMAAPEKTADVNRIVYKMESVRDKIDDLTATVEILPTADQAGQSETGMITLNYKKPDKLKTEVKGGRQVLINGDRMWIYSPDLGVVEAYHLKDEEQQQATLYEMSWGLTSPIKVLLRGTNRSAKLQADGSYLITVVPDQKDSEIREVRAVVDPRTWLISRMVISRQGRPPVQLEIKDWRINSGLPDTFFDFTLPEGAELFDALETQGEVLQ